MANLVKYGSYATEAADKEQAALESREYLKFEVGDNIVRILPPPPGKTSPFRVVWTHYVRVPGQEKPLVFVCPLKEGRQSCPICAHADRLKSSGNPADFDMARDFFAKRRVYANVIDRRNEAAGPTIMGFGKEIHEQLVALRKNPDWGGDFTDPVAGFDVNIQRTGTGKNDTSYKVVPKKQSQLNNLEWIEHQFDLEPLGLFENADQMLAKLAEHRPGARPPQSMVAAQSQAGAPQAMLNEQSQSRQPRPQTVMDMPVMTPSAPADKDKYPF